MSDDAFEARVRQLLASLHRPTALQRAEANALDDALGGESAFARWVRDMDEICDRVAGREPTAPPDTAQSASRRPKRS